MEKTGKKISHVTGVLARSVRIIIENILREGGALQEIRMRIGQPLTVMIDGEEQILPLKENAKVALVGKMAEKIRYQGAGSSHINPTKLTQPKEVIRHTSFAVGCDERGNTTEALIKEAVTAAKDAEVAIVFAGLTEHMNRKALTEKI